MWKLSLSLSIAVLAAILISRSLAVPELPARPEPGVDPYECLFVGMQFNEPYILSNGARLQRDYRGGWVLTTERYVAYYRDNGELLRTEPAGKSTFPRLSFRHACFSESLDQ